MSDSSGRAPHPSRSLLNGLVRRLGVAAVILNSKGSIVSASAEATRLLGLTRQALSTATLNSILSPRNPEWLSRQIRKSGSKEGWAGDVVVIHPGGERWVHIQACPAPMGFGGAGELMLVLEDVTERVEVTTALMKRAEDLYNQNWELELVSRVSKLLLSSEDLQFRLSAVLREAAQAAHADMGGIAILDRATNELVCRAVCGNCPQSYVGNVSLPFDNDSFTIAAVREGRTRTTKDAAAEPEFIRGIAEALNLKATLCVPLAVGDDAFGAVMLADSARRREFTAEEVRLVEILARNTALAIHSSLLASDVEFSRFYWQRTFDAISDMLFLLDAQGRFLRANGAFASRLSTSLSDLEGRACSEVLADVDASVWRRAVLARHPCSLGEMTIAGETCEVDSYPLLNNAGEPDAAIIYARIVTVERRLKDEIRQASRSAAVGELLEGAAHSLGNVLKSIEAATKAARPSSTGRSDSADQIRGQIQAGSEIIARLLSFSRGCEGKMGRVSLRQVTQAALSLCRIHPAAQNKTIRNLVNPGLPTVEAQQWPLQEAIFGLILNALEATAPGGCVTLSAKVLDRQGMVELRVIDNGCGMSPEVQDQAFTPFYSTKGGTGLGLSTSVAAVHRMGGVVSVDTSPGKGTVVSVRLNVADSKRRPRLKRAA